MISKKSSQNIHLQDLSEKIQAQLPFCEMLLHLGYTYLSIEEVNKQRKNKKDKFILQDIALQTLSKINEYEVGGIKHKFEQQEILKTIQELENTKLEGLIDTSKIIYQKIMSTGGKTIKVHNDGKIQSKSFKFIDFENIQNNDFSFTVEYTAKQKEEIRVDIVIFINGIPFVLIENKRASKGVEIAIWQHLRNQEPNKCPRLFMFSQLLIASNKEKLKYASIQTPENFWASWKEQQLIDQDWQHKKQFTQKQQQDITQLISQEIDKKVYAQIQKDLDIKKLKQHNPQRKITKQDTAVYNLLNKERLLDLVKHFILYDDGVKKVARYQQYFAVKKIQKRIKLQNKKRQGGIVWHTQGSGKSLTMALFVKALIENTNIQTPRVIIVTDRIDLDKQIKGTFKNVGLKKEVKQAKSGQHLLDLIKQKDNNAPPVLKIYWQNGKIRVKTKKLKFTDVNAIGILH